MAEERLEFQITADDQATPKMEVIAENKALLEKPIAIPITANTGTIEEQLVALTEEESTLGKPIEIPISFGAGGALAEGIFQQIEALKQAAADVAPKFTDFATALGLVADEEAQTVEAAQNIQAAFVQLGEASQTAREAVSLAAEDMNLVAPALGSVTNAAGGANDRLIELGSSFDLVAQRAAESASQMAAFNARLAAPPGQAPAAQVAAVGTAAEESTKAVGDLGDEAELSVQQLRLLGTVGAQSGLELAGLNARALSAAAGLAIVAPQLLGVVAAVGATFLGLNALNDAFGNTAKASDDITKLASTIGSGEDAVQAFANRVDDLNNDMSSFGNLSAETSQAVHNFFAEFGLGKSVPDNIAAVRKAMQEFNDVLAKSPAQALLLAEDFDKVAASQANFSQQILGGANRLDEVNKKIIENIDANANEAVGQEQLKGAIAAVTAARLEGINISRLQGETVTAYIARLEAEVLANEKVSASEAEQAKAIGDAALVKQEAAARQDVVVAAEERGIDATGKTVKVLGDEIQAWQQVNAAMEVNVEATVAQAQAQQAAQALSAARLEAAQLGVDAAGLGADATNRAIISQDKLNATAQDTVESAALAAAAKKKLADAEEVYTKAIEAGVDPMGKSDIAIKELTADAEAQQKAIDDVTTAQGNLNREFLANSDIVSGYAIEVGQAAASNKEAADAQQTVNKAIEDGIDPIGRNVDELGALVTAHDEVQKSNDQLISSLDTLDTKWVQVRDSVGGVEQDAQAFSDAWKKATEVEFGLADTSDNVTTAMANLVKREKEHGATLNQNTVEGNKQLILIENLRKAVGVDLAEAYRNAGGGEAGKAALEARAQQWQQVFGEQLPKDLDTTKKGVQDVNDTIGNIPNLTQKTLDIAVQQESLDKLKKVQDVIDLLPAPLQAKIQVQMGQDATQAVQFFDFLAKAERVKHELPIDAQLQIDKDLLAGNVTDVQKVLDSFGVHVELPTFLKDPAPPTPQQVEDVTGKTAPIPLNSEVTPPTPAQVAAAAAEAGSAASGVSLAIPVVPAGADQAQAALDQAVSRAGLSLNVPVNPGPPGQAALNQAISTSGLSLDVPVTPTWQGGDPLTKAATEAGITLPDPNNPIPVFFAPGVTPQAAQAAFGQIQASTKDPATGKDPTANVVVSADTKQAADEIAQLIAGPGGKGYNVTVHVTTDVPGKGTGTTGGGIITDIPTLPAPTAPTAPTVNVTQHITAGFGTNTRDLQKALAKANHRLNRLAGVRS